MSNSLSYNRGRYPDLAQDAVQRVRDEGAAVSEVERYCVLPGQACSYMLGKLQFLVLRERAKQRLGAKFDIRKFHDAVLLPGAMPLDMLDHLSV